jgi:hypothetical protein
MRAGWLALVTVVAFALGGLSGPEAVAKPKRGHGSITEGLDCSTCHTADGWKLLGGSGEGGGFDHARTGFPLGGQHKRAACTTCHRKDKRITRVCAGCHEDAHEHRLSQSCDRCHSAVSWKGTRSIERHRLTRLPLTGMHALADCSECHQRRGSREWSSPPADCFGCHAKDYRRTNIHPSHTGVAGDPTRPPFPHDCSQCHRPTGWRPAFLPASQTQGLKSGLAMARAPASHEARFPLKSGKHRNASCNACHTSSAVPRAVRCDGCHAHDATRLRRLHRRVLGARGGSCLGCHPGGARR